MRLFVTGLGGYLGRALAAADGIDDVSGTVRSRPAPPGLRTFAIDVRDERALADAIAAVAPDAIVHTAYLRDDDAWSVNVDGSAAVARAASAAGVRLVHLSSDVVFSGDLGRPLREDDPPAPVSAYGESKAAAEGAVAAACPGAVLVRTSLIYGGAEPSTYELAAVDPAQTFYVDELRCPVVAGDLATAIVELAALPAVAGPLHVAGPEAVTRLEFAQLLAAARGGDPAAVRGGSRPPDRAGDLRLDGTRARSLLRVRLRGVREVLGARGA
ncbi:MAG: sugar nucleotide-binding protein [Actinobacteria bacterium]|nr:sugar nucleotide-binding protein [Actinomycetota bacterium]